MYKSPIYPVGGKEVTSISSGSLLDDGLWHDVRIDRWLNKVSFTIDRVELKAALKGDFQMLDLDRVVRFCYCASCELIPFFV